MFIFVYSDLNIMKKFDQLKDLKNIIKDLQLNHDLKRSNWNWKSAKLYEGDQMKFVGRIAYNGRISDFNNQINQEEDKMAINKKVAKKKLEKGYKQGIGCAYIYIWVIVTGIGFMFDKTLGIMFLITAIIGHFIFKKLVDWSWGKSMQMRANKKDEDKLFFKKENETK